MKTIRVKSNTTKRVGLVQKKIKRAIQFAVKNGLSVADSLWYAGGKVCPMGAFLVCSSKKVRKAVGSKDFSTIAADVVSDVNDKTNTVARQLQITVAEVDAFITAFDGSGSLEDAGYSSTPRRVAMFRLGTRMRAQYV